MKVIVKMCFVVFLSSAIYLLFTECHAGTGEKHLTLAVLPCYDNIIVLKKFNRLAAYLKEYTGQNVDIVVPTVLERIRASLQTGEIDLILQDPHTYIQLSETLNRESLLSTQMWDGTSSQHALIIAREDSGIKTIKDLKGKTIMFGPQLSITRWIGAREILKENGIDPDKDLRAYSHGDCCEDIAFHVFLKAVDAGVVCDDFFDEHSEDNADLGTDLKRIMVIGRTRPFPTRVFAVRRGVDDTLFVRVNQALLQLDRNKPVHAEILAPTKIGGFQVSRHQAYEGLRTFLTRTPQ